MTGRMRETSVAARAWHATVANSLAVRAARAVVSLSARVGRRSASLVVAPRVDRLTPERREQALIRVVESSGFVRLLAWSGSRATRAWRHSAGAAAVDGWNGLPLDRRVRLSAIVLGAAVVVHLVLTRFSAPEATTTVRAVWIGILAAIAVAGWLARDLAAAWTSAARGGEGGERR